MQEGISINLEQYRIELDKILGYHMLDDSEDGEYLADSLLKNLFLSAIPSINDNIKEVNDLIELYPLIYLYPEYKKTASVAFMLTGEYGCGKRTADKFFSGIIYNLFGEDVLDDELRFYWINSDELIRGVNLDICGIINSLFDQLTSMLVDECKMNTLVYISLGNITRIMKHKKIAECFIRRLTQLKETPDVISIITCCYEGPASGIKDRYKEPFIVYEMKNPDTHLRRLYFKKMKERHKNIILEPDISQMASMTENCTFGMLEKVKILILMSAKGMAVSKGLDWDDFINNSKIPDDDKLKISTDAIYSIIETVRKSMYMPSSKKSVPVNYVHLPEVQPNKTYEETTYIDMENNLMVKNDNITKPDTLKELLNIRDSILPSINFKPEGYCEGINNIK